MKNENVIISVDCSKFLTFEGEKVLVAVKKHPLTLFANFFVIGLVLLFFSGLLTFSMYFMTSFMFILTGTMIIMIFGLGLVIHSLIDSYYHIYIVTNRKFLEIHFLPFSESTVNEILLDQVKCTEVDMASEGFIYNYFNIGSVVLTFDRPTHQKEYILHNIANYRQVGMILSQVIVNQPSQDRGEVKTREVWFKEPGTEDQIRFSEEIETIPKSV